MTNSADYSQTVAQSRHAAAMTETLCRAKPKGSIRLFKSEQILPFVFAEQHCDRLGEGQPDTLGMERSAVINCISTPRTINN